MSRFIIILVLFLVIGCGKYLKDTIASNDCTRDNPQFVPAEIPESDDYRLIVHENASLFLFQDGEELKPQIEQGNKLVFEYRYSKPVHPMMRDAGYTETILFEVKPELKSFFLAGTALEEANTLYGNLCFCPDAGYHLVKDGCITGKKSGKSEWLIQMNVKAYGQNREFSKMLSERFKVIE